MKTDDLISQLSDKLKPVEPWAAPWKLAVRFSTLSLVIVAGLLIMTGPRQDFGIKMFEPSFWIGLAGWTLFFTLGLELIFTLATPGRRVSRALWAAFGAAAIVVLGWHLHALMSTGMNHMKEGFGLEGVRCSLVTVLTSLILGSFVVYRAKRGASGHPLLSSFIVGAASLGIGGVLITLNCGDDNGMHVVLWHFMIPALFVAALASSLVKKLLHW